MLAHLSLDDDNLIFIQFLPTKEIVMCIKAIIDILVMVTL